jgi:hypothetical protein
MGTGKQHRHVLPIATDPRLQLEAVSVGEHDVEHDQVGREIANRRERLRPVSCRAHLEALVAQGDRNELDDVPLVVDNQNPGLRGINAHPHIIMREKPGSTLRIMEHVRGARTGTIRAPFREGASQRTLMWG